MKQKQDVAIGVGDLPEALELHRGALIDCADNSDDPHGEWPEGEQFMAAFGPAQTAKVLINAFHPGLKKAKIAYLWRAKLSGHGGQKVTLGKMSRADAKVKYFGEVQFVMELNYEAWQFLTWRQRIALVDHELHRGSIDVEKGTPVIVPHDVEEFKPIITKWGLWKPDLVDFGQAVVQSAQGELFAGATS